MGFMLFFLMDVVLTSKVRFEIEPSFLGHVDFGEKLMDCILESLSSVSKPMECARHCVEHQNCSAFGYNVSSNVCQLLGDVIFPRPSTFQSGIGDQRYYVIRKEWCPLESRYLLFRRTGLCLRMSTQRTSVTTASHRCQKGGRRLAVLNSWEKLDAVISAMNKLGFANKRFLVGASDNQHEGEWVWNDGAPMSDDLMWAPVEPNGNTFENCLLVKNGKLYDVSCENYEGHFLCEATQ